MGTALFRITITPLNGVGIIVVLIGSSYYSYVSIAEQTTVVTQASKDAVTENDDKEEDGLEEGIPLIAATMISNERGAVVRR